MDPIPEIMVKNAARTLGESAIQLSKDGGTNFNRIWSCTATSTSNNTKTKFEEKLKLKLESTRYILTKDKYEIPYLQPAMEMRVKLENKTTSIGNIAIHGFIQSLTTKLFLEFQMPENGCQLENLKGSVVMKN